MAETSVRRRRLVWIATSLLVAAAVCAAWIGASPRRFPERLWMPVAGRGDSFSGRAAEAPDTNLDWIAEDATIKGMNGVWEVTTSPGLVGRVLERLGFNRPTLSELIERGEAEGVFQTYLPTGIFLPGAQPGTRWQELVRVDWRPHIDRGPPHPEDVAGMWEHVTGSDPPVQLELCRDGSVRGLPFPTARWGRCGNRLGVLVDRSGSDFSSSSSIFSADVLLDAHLDATCESYSGTDADGAPVHGRRMTTPK